MGTTFEGSEVLVELRRGEGRPLRAQLEDGLREAARSGRLAAGSRLPATRALSADLGVSRRLVVDAYAQLLAEGYLVARPGSGTFVAETADYVAVASEYRSLAHLPGVSGARMFEPRPEEIYSWKVPVG